MRIGLLFAVFFFFYMSLAFSDDDEVIFVDRSDPEMSNAFSKAKASIDGFLDVVKSRPDNMEEFMAYIKFEDNEEVEYLWLADVQPYEDAFYIGVIVSKPGLVKNVEYGDTIAFEESDIYDWRYFDTENGKTMGSFTTCVLLKPGNPEDDAYKKETGLDCQP